MKRNKSSKKYIWFGLLAIFAIGFLFAHSFEATAAIRCDGNPVFPMSVEDTSKVTRGQMKFDNFISNKLQISDPELYDLDSGYTWARFDGGCNYVVISDFNMR